MWPIVFRHFLAPTPYLRCSKYVKFANNIILNESKIFCGNGLSVCFGRQKELEAPDPFKIFPRRFIKKLSNRQIIRKENIWTIPNVLCISRIIVSPYLGYLIVGGELHQAFYIMLFAGVTDILDGFIARNWYSQASKLGSFLDPMADKILIVTLVTTMSYINLIPIALSILIIARDVSLVSAASYIRYVSLPPPKTLSKYFDMSYATAQLAPTTISKLNTAVQLATIALTLTASVFKNSDHPALPYFWYLTAATTIASAASYLFSKNTYKILKKRRFRK